MPYIPDGPRRSYLPEKKEIEKKRSADNQPFYTSKAWRDARASKLSKTPMCEVDRYRGRVTEAKVVDHIIPIFYGGSRFASENLMSMGLRMHNRKTRFEYHGGKPIVDWTDTPKGRVPRNRDDVFKVLLNEEYSRGQGK